MSERNRANRRPTRFVRRATIRARLMTAFALIAVLPAATVGLVSALIGVRTAQTQITAQLRSIAALKEAEIDTWLETLQGDLAGSLIGEQVPDLVTVVVGDASSPADEREAAYRMLRAQFLQSLELTGSFDKLFLMDRQGRVVVSTDTLQRGQFFNNEPYFQPGLQAPQVKLTTGAVSRLSVVAVQPVLDAQGQVLGVMAGSADLDQLSRIMQEETGLGERAETYLVGVQRNVLVGSRFARVGLSAAASEAVRIVIDDRASGEGLYNNYSGKPVIGVYRWLPELQVALLAEQEQSEALRPTINMVLLNAALVLGSVLMAVLAALRFTQGIARPLSTLADTAEQIAAGNLSLAAPVQQHDETGVLAEAFNSMTMQLRNLIGSLEERVTERTEQLQRRARYLETSAQVARDAASALNLQQLLERTVFLIGDRFGFYHVGIFLLNETRQEVVLQAASSAGGRKMLARGHRLQVGRQGIVGYVARSGQPRVISDVGQDAVFFNNPDLPETRSEVALPLQARGEIIGVLDVQSTQESAFSEEDVSVLQTLADQIALAISNARLVQQAEESLEAAQSAYGQYSRQVWQSLIQAQPDMGFLSDQRGVVSSGDVWRPEMEQAVRRGETVLEEFGSTAPAGWETLPESAANVQLRHQLAVPIKVRGDVVGVLDTYKSAAEGRWTREELVLLEQISEQLGLALDSARLYQDSQRRAAHERTLAETSGRMRQSLDVEQVLRTAVREFGEALRALEVNIRLEPAAAGTSEVHGQDSSLETAPHLDDGGNGRGDSETGRSSANEYTEG